MIKKIAALLMTGSLVFTGLSASKPAYAANSVKRNTKFTTVAEMQSKLGTTDKTTWSPVYLTEVENTYWTFADQSKLGGTQISIDMAKNCYRNLEMLLDNGYTMDYNALSDYCEEYLGKKEGKPDAFYNVLTGCLNNPYLLNRPAAKVTATTYNGRDYSKVFDASYYLSSNPDLAETVGNDPAELLRHFVEVGVNEGRAGNAAFNVGTYAATVDAGIMANSMQSAAYRTLGAGAAAPVGKYSYSYANYYGQYLGHYSISAAVDSSSSAASES